VRYVVLLYGDEAMTATPGTPEFDVEMAGYVAFGEIAGDAIVAGEPLEPVATARTIRHDGDRVSVTDGPFAESVEVFGGFYVLDAPTLDDAIELVRHIPVTGYGASEIRPVVQWLDRSSEVGPAPEGAVRWIATIHGPETAADDPADPAWQAMVAEHAAFAEQWGDAVLGGAALQLTSTATTVRVRDGELLVTDGPFAESLEVVGGYYVLRATPEAVADVAAGIPVNDGGAVQVQRIMELEGLFDEEAATGA
jgi:hypothetical protein